MSTRAFWAVGLLVLAFSSACLAQDHPFYIGGNFGLTWADSGDFEQELSGELRASGFSSANVSADETDTGFKLLVGYQISPNVAVEAYYANLGKYTFTVNTTGPTVTGGGEFEVTGFGLDVVAIVPVTRRLSGFGRVGLFRWESEGRVSATGPGGTAGGTTDDDGTELKFGAGIEWALSPNLRLRGEAEYYNFDDKIMMFSAGVLYRF